MAVYHIWHYVINLNPTKPWYSVHPENIYVLFAFFTISLYHFRKNMNHGPITTRGEHVKNVLEKYWCDGVSLFENIVCKNTSLTTGFACEITILKVLWFLQHLDMTKELTGKFNITLWKWIVFAIFARRLQRFWLFEKCFSDLVPHE